MSPIQSQVLVFLLVSVLLPGITSEPVVKADASSKTFAETFGIFVSKQLKQSLELKAKRDTTIEILEDRMMTVESKVKTSKENLALCRKGLFSGDEKSTLLRKEIVLLSTQKVSDDTIMEKTAKIGAIAVAKKANLARDKAVAAAHNALAQRTRNMVDMLSKMTATVDVASAKDAPNSFVQLSDPSEAPSTSLRFKGMLPPASPTVPAVEVEAPKNLKNSLTSMLARVTAEGKGVEAIRADELKASEEEAAVFDKKLAILHTWVRTTREKNQNINADLKKKEEELESVKTSLAGDSSTCKGSLVDLREATAQIAALNQTIAKTKVDYERLVDTSERGLAEAKTIQKAFAVKSKNLKAIFKGPTEDTEETEAAEAASKEAAMSSPSDGKNDVAKKLSGTDAEIAAGPCARKDYQCKSQGNMAECGASKADCNAALAPPTDSKTQAKIDQTVKTFGKCSEGAEFWCKTEKHMAECGITQDQCDVFKASEEGDLMPTEDKQDKRKGSITGSKGGSTSLTSLTSVKGALKELPSAKNLLSDDDKAALSSAGASAV